MSRHSRQSAYGQRIRRISWDHWRLFWSVDRYISGSRLRFPVEYQRDTGTAGALRFCNRHGITAPDELMNEAKEL